MTEHQQNETTCCVVGGGPAGIFLGYLLARSGVPVIVLEKHVDFLRDFRGDTIHPSTLQLLYELGMLEDILSILDFQAEELQVSFEGKQFIGPTFTHLNTKCKFIGLAPQWDLLNLMSSKGKELPAFDLRMNTRATDVIREGERVVGIRCMSDEEEYEIKADLVIAADGRGSTIRSTTDHPVIDRGIPIDVLWFALARPKDDAPHTLAWLQDGHMLITIPRRDHYQIAMVIQKGSFEQIKAGSLEDIRRTIGFVCPLLKDVAEDLKSWDDIKLLSVQINRMQKWYEDGLLFIGDAAHAMSPVGGVGINLAIQDAVATANLLTEKLKNGRASLQDLQAVQDRREPAALKTQRMQVKIHSLLFGRGTSPGQPFSLPWYLGPLLRLFAPALRRFAGSKIGLGFQPEHIQTKPANPAD